MELLPSPILLVEDDPDDVTLFTMALGKVRPQTDLTVAKDGDAALEILSEDGVQEQRGGRPRPVHVVLDLKLPKKSGLEVIEIIRQRRGSDVRMVILTSSQLTLDLQRARKAGVGQYYVKPPKFSELLEVVRRILQEWRLLP
jgi:CheY-like chemotaxis protein